MIENFLLLAVHKARKTMNQNIGGPFGATIVDADGNIVAVESNSVLRDCDPTAHAEINAIREAGKVLGTHDLTGCRIYTTGYPCPMCLAAIIWSNIKEVIYGCPPEDAEAIGFRDDFIYRFIETNREDKSILSFEQQNREECLKLFEEYSSQQQQLY